MNDITQEQAMENATIQKIVESASEKMATGALMTIEETAAWFDVSSQTVHKLPLQAFASENHCDLTPLMCAGSSSPAKNQPSAEPSARE